MRRPTSVEVMLLSAIVLWALNLTVSRYILTHGFQPLAFSTVRYGARVPRLHRDRARRGALAAHRPPRLPPRSAAAALVLFVNQIGFVYALKTTSASVIALILAATPIIAALIGLAFGTEVLPRRFWLGAALSFAGVALVALGATGQLGADVGGILFGILTASTWAVYSILITPADAALLAGPDQRRRPAALVGRDRARRPPADAVPGLAARLGGLGARPVCDARPARRHEHPLVQVPRQHRRRRGRRSRRTCSRSSPPSSRSCCSARRSTPSRWSAAS